MGRPGLGSPTRAGWGLAVASAATFAVGRVFGLVELMTLSVAALVVAAAALATLRTPRTLDVERRMSAGLGPRGGHVDVEVRVSNSGRRRTPAVLLRNDTTAGGFRALLGPLAPGEAASETYRLPLRRRGRLVLDPLEVVVTDPLGLASSGRQATPAGQVLVVPCVTPVAALPRAAATSEGQMRSRPGPLVPAGQGEFHSLRDWRDGDELRSVHWRSTLRTGRRVVREDEATPDGFSAVVVDVRTAAWDRVGAPGIDAALDAAASVVSASLRVGQRVRLVDGHGGDTGFGTGTAHLERILADLAVLTTGDDSPTGLLAAADAVTTAGAVVLVTGRPDDVVAGVAARLGLGRAVGLIVAEASTPSRAPVAVAGTGFASSWARVAAAMERAAA